MTSKKDLKYRTHWGVLVDERIYRGPVAFGNLKPNDFMTGNSLVIYDAVYPNARWDVVVGKTRTCYVFRRFDFHYDWLVMIKDKVHESYL